MNANWGWRLGLLWYAGFGLLFTWGVIDAPLWADMLIAIAFGLPFALGIGLLWRMVEDDHEARRWFRNRKQK